MLEYSLYVHLLGVALVLGVSALLDSAFHLELHLNELPSKQPHEFLSAYFIEGTLLFTLYPLYVVVASVLLGAYSIPHRAATGIVKGGGLLARGLGAISYMGWIKAPSPDFPIEPIWYKAFHVATDGFTRSRPAVMVKMKRGDIYYGVLDSYPILPDSQRAKDFLIVQAQYAPAGHQEEPYRLEDMPGGGTVLLNSEDVDSIQPGFPILGVFRLKGQPKRDSGSIVRSCKASQSPVYPMRDAIAVVEHPSCPSSSSSCPLPVG